MDFQSYVDRICRAARDASRSIARMPASSKNDLLRSMAAALRQAAPEIISENKKDLEEGKRAGISDALYDRLLLDEKRIEGMARSIEEIAALPDPVGRVENMKVMESGIRVGQMRVPLGTVAVIFESRPNVTTDIAALCIKSGNASILRGGKEAIFSNRALHEVVTRVIRENHSDPAIVSFIGETDRGVVPELLKRDDMIDIVIPRGGEGLIKMVTELSSIPVIKHDKGLCHIFVDESALPEMAEAVSVNAKVQRPGVCNAVETLLIHSGYRGTKELLEALDREGVELRGCARTVEALPNRVKTATDEDWDTEYLDLILSVQIVDSLDDAMDHIARHSSGHSEAIITTFYPNADRFINEVDSAAVFVNASTRFHDGGEFGLGAEVGISTEKLHARGAMGVEGLTTLKYVVTGRGEIR